MMPKILGFYHWFLPSIDCNTMGNFNPSKNISFDAKKINHTTSKGCKKTELHTLHTRIKHNSVGDAEGSNPNQNWVLIMQELMRMMKGGRERDYRADKREIENTHGPVKNWPLAVFMPREG